MSQTSAFYLDHSPPYPPYCFFTLLLGAFQGHSSLRPPSDDPEAPFPSGLAPISSAIPVTSCDCETKSGLIIELRSDTQFSFFAREARRHLYPFVTAEKPNFQVPIHSAVKLAVLG